MAALTAAAIGAGACEGDAGTAMVGDGGTDRPRGTTTDSGFTPPADMQTLGDFGVMGRPDRAPVNVMVNSASKKLLPATAQLLGLHRSGCSHGVPATGDGSRWCAFSTPGMRLGDRELWVINVNKAATSTVSCTQSNPDCIRLADKLFAGQPDAGPAYPTAHRFYGDTLIYYANNTSRPTELYEGPIFAWRPGWPAGKQISSNKGVLCSGHTLVDVAVCIENITPEGVEPVKWDLTAGKVDQGPFKLVGRITPVRANGAVQWRSGFTLEGDYFAYSTGGDTVNALETLYVMKASDIGNPAAYIQVGGPMGAGISRWTISGTGANRKFVYLRNFNYSTEGDPSGTLAIANFPMGDGEKFVESSLVASGMRLGVGVFQMLTDLEDKDRGIGILQRVMGGRGTYTIINDPSKSLEDPKNVVQVATGIGSVPITSPDLRYSYYAREFDMTTDASDAYVARNDGSGNCPLQRSLSTGVFGFPFLLNGGLAIWADALDPATDSGEGWAANPADCTGNRKKFSSGIDFWFVNRDDGLVYSDASDGEAVTLRYVTVGGGALGTPVEIQRQIGRLYSVLPGFTGVLYNVTSGVENTDGVYYYKLPFGGPAPDGGAPADGGAPPADAAPTPADAASGN